MVSTEKALGKGERLVTAISRSYNMPTWRSFRYKRLFEEAIDDKQVEKWIGTARSEES